MGTAGAAVAALLIAHPLEAGAAVAALAAQGLLAAVWRTVPEAAAAQLTASLALATGFTVPDWPDDPGLPGGVGIPSSLANLVARARAMWAEALAPVSPRSEAVRAAAVLALLRWSPRVLRSGDRQVWQALLAHLTSAVRSDARHEERAGEPEPSRQLRAEEPSAASERNEAARSQYSDRAPQLDPEAHVTPDAPPVHGERISTGWGGVLFLINALRRLHIEVLLDAAGADAPTGWRLLHDLGLAYGMPEDDPLAEYLAAQDLDSDVSPGLLAQVLGDIEALYEPDGPWPLPLAQPAVLRATETHLDLDLMAKDIDIALRLSGLDLDPGWVPWLGRVVAFHYDQLPTVFHRAG